MRSTIHFGRLSYKKPFAAMTMVFFVWGFMMTWNDLLIPRFKDAFTLNYFEAMLVQFAFSAGYAIGALIYYLLSVLVGDPIGRIGYKNGVIIGLLIASVGSALFYPAALAVSYGFFLTALFVIGLGFAMLQIAANPYVIVLGPEATASSRLNLASGFSSVGTTIGPIVGGWLIFSSVHKARRICNRGSENSLPLLRCRLFPVGSHFRLCKITCSSN